MNLDMARTTKALKTTVTRRPRKKGPKLYVGLWVRRLGMKQVEVARAAGIGESYMSSIVNEDKYPGPGVAFALAEALGISEALLRQAPPPAETIEAAAQLDPELVARLRRHAHSKN